MPAAPFWVRWVERARELPLRESILAGAGLLLLAGMGDWWTGPEIASAVFYLPAIIWMTWKGGRWPGLGMALASGATWLGMVLAAHSPFDSPLVPYWNAVVRATTFCLVSGLASEVFERKRVERRLRQSHEDLQRQAVILESIQRQIAETSDREQRRLGEDLHDGLCQHLVSIAFAARGLAAKLTDRSLPEAEDAAEIAELLGVAIAQARDVARGLCLVPLEAGGLASALEELATRVRSRHRIACQLVEKGSVPALEETVGTNLFRLAQEAVNNAIKHAQPTRILVTLWADPEQIGLEIEDDGIGFQPGREPARGLGLHIMNYRAQMVGAALTLAPRSGGGTRVTCRVRRSNLKEPPADNHDERN